MPLEIERKFLVRGDYKKLAVSSSHIIQGYICSAHGRTVRVRQRDEQGWLTIKGPSDASGLARYEFEKQISPEETQQLLKLCEPGIIDKTRWIVPCGKHVCEVDEFHGDNNGLVVAEIELKSTDDVYTPLPFLGREVTGDRRFYNSELRVHPFKDWSGDERKNILSGE